MRLRIYLFLCLVAAPLLGFAGARPDGLRAAPTGQQPAGAPVRGGTLLLGLSSGAEVSDTPLPPAITWAFGPDVHPYLSRDLARAREELARAGMPEGLRFTLQVSNSDFSLDPAEQLRACLARSGCGGQPACHCPHETIAPSVRPSDLPAARCDTTERHHVGARLRQGKG